MLERSQVLNDEDWSSSMHADASDCVSCEENSPPVWLGAMFLAFAIGVVCLLSMIVTGYAFWISVAVSYGISLFSFLFLVVRFVVCCAVNSEADGEIDR